MLCFAYSDRSDWLSEYTLDLDCAFLALPHWFRCIGSLSNRQSRSIYSPARALWNSTRHHQPRCPVRSRAPRHRRPDCRTLWHTCQPGIFGLSTPTHPDPDPTPNIESAYLHITFSTRYPGNSSISRRICVIPSRSRTVTVWSSSVWKSTVTQNGVPISSCLR